MKNGFITTYLILWMNLRKLIFSWKQVPGLAGYDIGRVLNDNQQLKNHILEILKREIAQDAGKISRYYYNKAYFDEIETIKRLFVLIIKGINIR